MRLKKEIKKGAYFFIHFGMPCSSFSIIQAINGGTRTSESPQGSGDKPNEMYGNRLADVMCELCWLQNISGGKFSIENPLSSFLWKYPPVDQLSSICVDIDLDQCEYGLRPPHRRRAPYSDLRIKKPTRLRTSLHSLSALSVKCRGNHAHWRCLGSVRDDSGRTVSVAKAAGHYPDQLCQRWAEIVCSASATCVGCSAGARSSSR